MRFVFIDSRITDISNIVSTFTSEVSYYVFDWNTDTFASLKDSLTQQYDSVGIIQHNYYESKYRLLFDASESVVSDVNREDPDLLTWTQYIDFLQWIYTNCNISAVDLFACDLWSNNDWKYIIQTISDKYNIHIRASVNITGAGGDFILESDNFDTIGVYFTEDILQYKYAFTYQSYTSYEQYGNYKYTPYVLHDKNPGMLKNSYKTAASAAITFPTLASDISNVKFVVSNGNAAVARLVTGNAVIVGTGVNGGNPSQTVKDALNTSTNVVQIVCNDTAFCAIYVPSGQTQRRVIHWGFYNSVNIETIGTSDANFNNISTVQTSLDLTDISDVEMNSVGAFAALNVSGQIYTWGDKRYGGNLSSAPVIVSGSTAIATWLSGKRFSRITAGKFHFGAIDVSQNGIIWGSRLPIATYTNGSFFTSTSVSDFYLTNTQEILCSGFIQYSPNNVNLTYTTSSASASLTLVSGTATSSPIFTLQRMAGGRTTATAIPSTSEVWVYLDNAKRLRMFLVTNGGVPSLHPDVTNNNTFFFSASPSVLTYKEGSTLKSYATTTDGNATNNTNYTAVGNGSTALSLSLTPIIWYRFESSDLAGSSITNYGSLANGNGSTNKGAGINTTIFKLGTGSADLTGTTSSVSGSTTAKYIGLPNFTLTTSQQFSISFWMYTTGTGGYSFVLSLNNAGTDRIYVGYNGGTLIISNNITFPGVAANTWLYVGWSQNGSTATYRLNDLSGTASNGVTGSRSFNYRALGANLQEDTKNWGGYVDQFRFFDGVLTASDLQNLYNEGPPPIPPGFLNFNSNRLIKYIPSSNTVEAYGSGVSGTTALTETYSNATDMYTSANVFAVSQTTPSQYTIVEAITNTNGKTVISKPAGSNVYFGPSGKGLYALEVPNNPILSPKIIPLNASRTINYYVSNPDLAAFRWSTYALSTSNTSVVQVGSTFTTYDNISSTYTFTDVSFTSVGKKTLYIWNTDPDLSFNVLTFDLSVATITPVVPSSLTLTKLSSTSLQITVTQSSPPESYFAAGIGYYYYLYSSGTDFSGVDASYSNLIGNVTDETYPEIKSTVTGLVVGTRYTFYVKAKSSTGGGNSTAISQQITIFDLPLAPNSVNVTLSGSNINVSVVDTNNSTNNDITYWYYAYNTSGGSNNNGDINSYTSGAAFTSSPTNFSIPGLIFGNTYIIYIVAKNVAGNSAPVASSSVFIGTAPLAPTIDSANTKSTKPGTITVALTDTTNIANNGVSYYYSTDGTSYTNSNVLFNGSGSYQFDVSGLTGQTTPYTIYVRAQNQVGFSSSVSTSPLPVFGNLPVISSVSPVLGSSMHLRVVFNQTPFKGTSPVTYYYSRFADGSNPVTATDGSFLVTDASQATRIFVVARNDAGNLVSVGVSGTPYLLGDKPTLTAVPVLNSPGVVRLQYFQTNTGTTPVTYSYSTSPDGVTQKTTFTSNPMNVSGVTGLTTYYIVADNSGGPIVSDGSAVTPYLLGSKPTIDSVTPDGTRSVLIAFTQSSTGNGTPVYYYGFDGSSVRLDASSTTSPIRISNLSSTSLYSIYVVARNEAGDISSNSYPNISVFGSKPSITGITKNVGNSVTVAFTQLKGTDPTTYYYSLDGSSVLQDVSSTGGTITIPNLTDASAYSISIVANNPAGNVFSDASSNVIILGTTPTLTAVPVSNADRVVRLTYTQTNSGTSPTNYYYTTDNSANTVNRTEFIVGSSTVDVSDVASGTIFYVIASNAAGNVISGGESVTPYVIGSKPTLTAVPVLNYPGVVRIQYFQTNTGTTPVRYSYSTSQTGIPKTAFPVDSSQVDVSGVTELTTYYIVADNSGGQIISDGSAVTPYLLGDKPIITSVDPSGTRSVSIAFTQSSTGSGSAPVYYYGFDGSSVRLDASATSSPIVISNLTNTTLYSIYVVARNEAGDISSNSYPNISVFGSKPSITGITKNIGNSVTVAFTQLKGTDPTTYYYSLDGSSVRQDASSNGTSITIPGLTETTAYSIYIVASNAAGNVFSDASSNITIRGTTPTITNIVKNIENSITVTFDQSQQGTDNTIYYGSLDGSNIIQDASSTSKSTPITISNLNDPLAYNIYVIARNPAGDVPSVATTNVSILGTTPSFTLVPQTNNLLGTITQTNRGTLPVKYYYSSNGTDKDFEVSFPTFDISGTVARTFYIIADNSAGSIPSSPVSGTPFTFGTVPTISSIVPSSEKLTVNFSQTETGTTPVTYYYSYDPSGTTRIAQVNPPSFDISGTQPRTVYIVVDNSAGTLVSQGVSGTPYTYGTNPIITLIQRGSEKITVTYTQADKGTLPVRYYYSFDRTTRIAEVTGTSTFDILYDIDSRIGNITYGVTVNGGLYSFTGEATGNNPSITVVKGSILTFNVNTSGHPFWIKTENITGTDYAVSSDITNNGTQSGTIVWNTTNVTTGTYYYICQYHPSMVGSIVVIPPENNRLTATKNVSIIADNSAGTLVSADVSGTPYTFGSIPAIQSVTPGPNKLTVLFSQETLGNTPSSYSYSYDASGSNPISIDDFSSTFTVNGTLPRTIYVIATNLAGTLISLGVSGTPFIVGDSPSIDNVIAGPYSLTVQFSQQNQGNTPVTYYYSFTDDGANPQGPVYLPQFTVPTSEPRTIYVVADSSSGYLVSNGVYKVPFILGDNPTIDSIQPGTETLQVSFSQANKGTEPVTYYYSYASDGSNPISSVISPFTISTTVTRTVYVVARNSAGNLVSAGRTETPYTFANKPVISDIVPSAYNLKVYFSPSTSGTTPITYYYSESSDGLNRVGPVTSPFDISGSTERTIYIVADNSAGYVVSTPGFTKAPYIFGSIPVIDPIVPGPNKMTVTFSQASKGTEPVTYYYSYEPSGSNGVFATYPSFEIAGTSTRTVYIVANNIIGNVVSAGVTGIPYVVGGTPIIESVLSQTNNLRVTFSHPEPGNTEVTYYYSDDASGNNLIRQVYLSGSTGTFDISGTITRTIYVVSINSAGKLISAPYTATPFIFGTTPVIETVTPGTGRLSVKFRQDQTGTTPVAYYYSFFSDGSNAIGPVDLSFNFPTTVENTIYIVASNSAGNLISAGVSGTPFIYGSKPVMTAIVPGLNKLTVSFNQAQTGTTPVKYYYSEFGDGSNRVGPVTSPFDISNISTLKTIYIIADNSAGFIISDPSSGTPYLLGTNPVVDAMQPGTNKLTVSFSQTSRGTEPVRYYYSEYSNGSNRIGPVTSPFDISNIQIAKTIYIIAENSGGTLISTSGATGTPYIFGTTPSITTVQPGTNSLIVTFSPSTGGTTPINHYYSYDSSGIPRVGQIQSGASTFTITDISAAKTVYIVAENPAGNLVSSGQSGTPFIFGDRPVISSVLPGTNKLIVNFSQTIKGTLPVTYYYSFDGSGRLGVVTTPSFEIPTTVQRTVYIIADNSAGTLVSTGVQGTPYTFGTPLNVSLSSPISNTIRVSYSQTSQGTIPTTYSYVLNNEPRISVGTSQTGTFDVSGLAATSLYSFYMVASNSAGDVSSNTVTQSVLGTIPTLSIVSQPNNLRVNFAQSNTGTLPIKYYYSFDGVTKEAQVNTPAFDISGTVQRTVYIIADNSAGTIVSTGVQGMPFVVGVPPTVSIQPELNKLTVSFSQTNKGTEPVTYYYSDASNGSNRIGPVTSPFDISGSIERTIYIVANNIAGNVISGPATGRPYILGSEPVINTITPGINSIIVDFSGSTGGYPNPYAYYYSLDGADYIIANSVTSPITIKGLTVVKPYTVTLIALNSAGFTLPSNMMSGIPIYEQPVFNSFRSSPPKDINSISGGSFAQDRRKFVNSSAFIISANLAPEEQITQIKLQNKSRTGPGRVTGEDLMIKKRVTAIGRAAFSQK